MARSIATPAALAALLALGGCQTFSAADPAGRNLAVYGTCLGKIYGDSAGTPAQQEAAALSHLAGDIGSGAAFTVDQSDGQIWAYPVAGSAPNAAGLRKTEAAPFQKFLDCYVGPVDPIDFETRLLRGHMALAMIANYTAAVVSEAAPAKKKQYAESAIGMISAAELGLRSASWAQFEYATAHAKFVADKTGGSFTAPAATFPKPTYADNPMRAVSNVQRIDKILTTATFADTIAIRNIYGLILSFAGEATSHGSSPVSIAESAASQALEAFGAAIRSNSYDAARFSAARTVLTSLQNDPPIAADTATPDGAVNALITGQWPHRLTYWTIWDSVISDACGSLSAASATTPAATCIPTDDQITTGSPWSSAQAVTP
jgi:hypothetical protein